ncbi:hypothetical protein [Kitasatospora griseola]|uniref:hypothetical protein n=1 Tax=Kitasatospora griseola TaxID=2064 RepID=UPI00344058D3
MTAPGQVAQLVSVLLDHEGVLSLTARLTRQGSRALDLLGSEPESNPSACRVRRHFADVTDAIEGALAATEDDTPDLTRGLGAWASTSPAEITAAHGTTGPRLEAGERLHLFWVEGAYDRAPYLGLVGPDHTDGNNAHPYCTAGFTREVAERITADLAADSCGLTARWGSGGDVRFSWTAEHASISGSEDIEPDDRGLYRIGGLWPWHSFEIPPQRTQATDGAAPDPAAAVRQLIARLAETTDPAEAARLVEQAEQHLDELSDFFATAARWSGAREGTAHLQLDLGRTSQDVYEAGADLADVATGLRAAAPRPARIRSTVGPASAAAPPATPVTSPPSLRR